MQYILLEIEGYEFTNFQLKNWKEILRMSFLAKYENSEFRFALYKLVECLFLLKNEICIYMFNIMKLDCKKDCV